MRRRYRARGGSVKPGRFPGGAPGPGRARPSERDTALGRPGSPVRLSTARLNPELRGRISRESWDHRPSRPAAARRFTARVKTTPLISL